jgi:RNA recognition motif-containing protein
MLGDLPDADLAPPENVLFVCKLNPVTQDEDLELIFSRFGTIKECAVVRDYKTGDSLNYAFIEFEDVASCTQVRQPPRMSSVTPAAAPGSWPAPAPSTLWSVVVCGRWRGGAA